jgi:BA14K-like protein
VTLLLQPKFIFAGNLLIEHRVFYANEKPIKTGEAMMGYLRSSLFVAALAAAVVINPAVGSAMQLPSAPLASAASSLNGPTVEPVRWNGRHRDGGNAGVGIGVGIGIGILGAILNNAIQEENNNNFDDFGPRNRGVAYCMRRFRSYDRESQTYLGYDGQRHYCP